jgi:hypothetical protein
MRLALLPALLVFALGACRCAPEEVTAVTLRIRNPLPGPIFVDATDGLAGVFIKRRVGLQWVRVDEEPRCACLACDAVCGGCSCPSAERGLVMRIPERSTFERTWAGRVQLAAFGSCSDTLIQGPACVRPEIPHLDEELRAELCYALAAPGAEDAAPHAPVPGALVDGSVLCVERSFRIEEGEVELSPSVGAPCAAHQDCTGKGELCLSGGCTPACPLVLFTQVGAGWQVRIPEPDDEGFFAQTSEGGRKHWRGSGSIGSVRYENETLTVRLTRPGPGGAALTGTLYVTVPKGQLPPLQVGEAVEVLVADASSSGNPENRGAVIREAAGRLLLAADTAQGASALTAAEVAPFEVVVGGEVFGCAHDDCGKRYYRPTTFLHPEGQLAVPPGSALEAVVSGDAIRFVNVGNQRYESTWCRLQALTPYVIFNARKLESSP